jgi:hypothetical protein
MEDFYKIEFSDGYFINKNAELIGKRGFKLKPVLDKKTGYHRVSIYLNGKLKIYKIHRLIWKVFYGDIPSDLQINHINGVKTDNRLSNLELVTPSQNCKHAWDNGLSRGKTKLSKEQIDEILSLPITMGAGEICKKYNVERHTINFHRLKHFGKKWKKRKYDLPTNMYYVESKKAYRYYYLINGKKTSKTFKKLEDGLNFVKSTKLLEFKKES